MGYKTGKGFETAVYKGVGAILKAAFKPKAQPVRRGKAKTKAQPTANIKSKTQPVIDVIYARKETRHVVLDDGISGPIPTIVLYADEAMTFPIDMMSTTTDLRPKRSDSFYTPIFCDVTYQVIWLAEDMTDHGEVFNVDYDIEARMRVFKTRN